MIAKQRQYKKFEQNLKQAITNVEKYYSAISDMKKDSASKIPHLKGRLIRRQKLQTYNTVQDQPADKQHQKLKYASHTPKEPKTEENQGNQKRVNRDKVIKEFRMEQSFSNKYNTVKKEFADNTTITGVQLPLTKEQISLKLTKKDKQCSKPFREPKIQHINIEEEDEPIKNQSVSGNGVLKLEKGWVYKGEYSQGLFHGYGELYHNDEQIYSGTYQYGYFHGYGKLKNHEAFEYLVSSQDLQRKMNVRSEANQRGNEWMAYFGEFNEGNVTGYGELWLQGNQRIVAKWVNGKIKGRYSVKLDSNSEVE